MLRKAGNWLLRYSHWENERIAQNVQKSYETQKKTQFVAGRNLEEGKD
jgi:hypothetical protein